MAFTIRQFHHSERLGDKLKALRKEANFTLSDMERLTKISRTYLQLIESGDFCQLPDPIYTRNYLKVYLRVFQADEKYFLNIFEQEHGTCDFITQARLPRQRTQAFRFFVASRFIKIGVFACIALAIFFYLGVQVREIISPPKLAIYEPTDGFTTNDATILVTGTVEDDASVRVNGINVLLNKNGTFDVEVALERGLNLITIESIKRYSRPSIEYRRVILQQDRSVSLAPHVDNN